MKIFDTRAAAITYLTDAIVEDLEALNQDRRTLWLSGGSTPIPLYEALAEKVDFSEFQVGLVDERWVPETDAGSNAAMIKRTLLKRLSVRQRDGMLLPMYVNGESLSEDAAAMDAAYQEVFAKTAPIVVLGMGGDGHTASWFPNLPNLDEICSTECEDWVVAVDATGSEANATTQRVTLTGAALDHAFRAYLFITGAEKRAVFEDTAAKLPIHRAADLLGDRLEIVWAD